MASRPAPCTKHRQAGLSLIEALVSTLLLMITFVGMNHLLTRSLTVQGQDYAMSLALFDVREQLQHSDKGVISLCDGSGQLGVLALASDLQPSASCESINSVSVTLPSLGGSITVPIQGISITTPNGEQSGDLTSRLFGGDGVISLSTTLSNTP